VGKRLVLLALFLSLCSCGKLAKRLAHEVLKPKQARTSADAGAIGAAGFTESYHSPNGLITAHYPADFAAKVTGKAALMMSRNLDDDEVELITLVSVGEPISPDLNEFTRTVSLAEVKKLDGYQQVSKTNTKCMGVDGVEIVSTWKPGATNYRRRWCGFLRNGHGYAFAYTLPAAAAESDESLLRAVVDATTFDQ
jgi:hypothetical protein